MAWPGRSNREIGLQVSRPPNFTAVKAGLLSSLTPSTFYVAILQVFSRELSSSLDSPPLFIHAFIFSHAKSQTIAKSLARKFEEPSLEFSPWMDGGKWMEFRVKNKFGRTFGLLGLFAIDPPLSRSLFSLCDQYLRKEGRKSTRVLFFPFPFFRDASVWCVELRQRAETLSPIFSTPEKRNNVAREEAER